MLRAGHNQVFTRWSLFSGTTRIFMCNSIDLESKWCHIACMYYLYRDIVVNMSVEKKK